MAYIQMRNTVLGVMEEVTEGTLLAPASSADYAVLQDDFEMAPNTEKLDNAELTGSIGMAKKIQGVEAPTASFSSYLKHSGVEGQAPQSGPLLKALFGAEDVEGTEYNTVAASTVSVIKVDSGEGANYRVGQALLIKDGSNNYAIRPIHSISSDDLTLGFDLSNAPGTGVDLGKAVTYYPADSGHPTLSLTGYIGNGGAVRAISGARTVGYSLTADAGQLVNGNFSFEGVSTYFNPVEIASSDIYIDFTETGPVTHAATVEAKWYKDPEQLATAIQTAMNALATVDTFTVVYNSKGANAGKYTFTSDGTVFSLLWLTGANTANGIADKVGFATVDETGALTYSSDTVAFYAAPHTPAFDDSSPLAAKAHEVLLGDSDDIICVQPSTLSIDPTNTRSIINDICADTGQAGSLITARETTISLTAILPQYCVENMARYRRNDEIRFSYIFGTKADGTNWDAGYSGCIYSPTCTITDINIVNEDGIARMTLELQPFVTDGDGELYLSYV